MAIQELYKSVEGTDEVLYPVSHTDAVVDMPVRLDDSGYVRPGDLSPTYGQCTGAAYSSNQSTASGVRHVGGPVPIGTGDFSIEFYGNTYGITHGSTLTDLRGTIYNAAVAGAYYVPGAFAVVGAGPNSQYNGIGTVIFDTEEDSVAVNYAVPDMDLFHGVITRAGTTVSVFVNGVLVGTKEQSAVKDLGDFRLGLSNSSHIVFCRLYNYALIQAEVNELWNGGRPYVTGAPLHFLHKTKLMHTSGGEVSHTWAPGDSTDSVTFTLSMWCIPDSEFEVTVEVTDYVSGSPSITYGGTTVSVPAENGVHTVSVSPAEWANAISYSGGPTTEDRSLTVRIMGVMCVGPHYNSDFTRTWDNKEYDGWTSRRADVTLSVTDSVLEATASTVVSDYYLMLQSSFYQPFIGAYRAKVVLAEPIAAAPGARVRLFILNSKQSTPLPVTVGASTEFTAEFRPYASDLSTANIYLYFTNVNAATTIRVASVSFEPLKCIAEYVPAGLTETGWRDTVGHNDLTAYNAPTQLTSALPDLTHFTISTGVFYTNIASGVANKDINVPAGYVVEAIRMDNLNNATLSDVFISDMQGHYWVHNSGASFDRNSYLYMTAPYLTDDLALSSTPVDITNGITVRVNASGNTTSGGLAVRVYCRCVKY